MESARSDIVELLAANVVVVSAGCQIPVDDRQDERRIGLLEIVPQECGAVERAGGFESGGELFLGKHRLEPDSPREIARVDHVVDLRAELAIADRGERRRKYLVTKSNRATLFQWTLPVDVNDVRRGDIADVDVLVGNRPRTIAIAVDDQQDV